MMNRLPTAFPFNRRAFGRGAGLVVVSNMPFGDYMFESSTVASTHAPTGGVDKGDRPSPPEGEQPWGVVRPLGAGVSLIYRSSSL